MNTNKEKNFISAVIYVYNDVDRIYDFLQTMDSLLTESFEKIEFICVNDASTDSSAEEIRKYSKTSSSTVTILNMSYHQGLELAMNAGVDLAIGDFVYEFESAQLFYPTELIKEVYFKSLQGFDIVAAAPENSREVSSAWFYRLYNRFSGSQYKLQTEAFRIVSRRGINRVKAMAKTIPYRKAIYANCGLRKETLSFTPKEAFSKQDQTQRKDRQNTAVDSLILYTDMAFRWAMGFSVAMMIIMAVISIYVLVIRLQGIPVAGWSSTILFLAFAFFGLFAILTAVIKYLSIILKLNFNRLNYVIESIEKVK